MLNAFWLIPILPLLGFLINGLALKWMPRKLAGYLAWAGMNEAGLAISTMGGCPPRYRWAKNRGLSKWQCQVV